MPITTYDAARVKLEELLTEHNKALPKNIEKVNAKATMARVMKEGGTSLPGLRAFERQDFIDFGFPRALAAQAVDALRAPAKLLKPTKDGPAGAPAGSGSAIVIRSEGDAVRAMGVAALVDSYDPSNPGIVGDELNARAKSQAFLVFTDTSGSQLDRKASAERLQAIIDGVPVTDHVMVDGEPIVPFHVGERPNVFLAENPLYEGRALRQPGDVCDATNESWTGVPNDVRILLAVAVANKELRLADPEQARSVIAAARADNALQTFKGRYPRSAANLREMTPAERPTLQLSTRRQGPSGGGTPPPFVPRFISPSLAG